MDNTLLYNPTRYIADKILDVDSIDRGRVWHG